MGKLTVWLSNQSQLVTIEPSQGKSRKWDKVKSVYHDNTSEYITMGYPLSEGNH